MAIAAYRNRDARTHVELRRDIRKQVSQEFDGQIASVALDEAVNEARRTKDSVIRRRMNGEKCEYRFRTRKSPRQSFVVQKLGKTPYPTLLGEVFVAECIPDESRGRLATVVYEYGRWFLCCKQLVAIRKAESQGLRVVAVDPGVRTFATVFSFDGLAKIGEQFSGEKLYGLATRLDCLVGERAKLRTVCPQRYADWKQWHWDRWRNLEKRINKLRNRISDLVDDLHRRAAHWLTESYDLIFLPTFEVKGMTARGQRKIRSKTVRQMLSLGHYRFKCLLKWIARKKGKHVVDTNESYTSKTDSRTGEVKQIGGSKTINGLDRDVNGARGILLRALTRQLEPEIITTPGVSDVAVRIKCVNNVNSFSVVPLPVWLAGH